MSKPPQLRPADECEECGHDRWINHSGGSGSRGTDRMAGPRCENCGACWPLEVRTEAEP